MIGRRKKDVKSLHFVVDIRKHHEVIIEQLAFLGVVQHIVAVPAGTRVGGYGRVQKTQYESSILSLNIRTSLKL